MPPTAPRHPPGRPRRRQRRTLPLAVTALAALAAVLLGATPAAAHATLTGSTPGDGEVVATQPARVVLDFSEQVALADDAIRVLDPGGERADTGELSDLSSDDGGVRHAIALRPRLPEGTYTVAWHVVSADSHPISGAFTFSIGAPSDTTVDAAREAGAGGQDGATGLLYDAARYAAYAGFVLLAGGGTFILWCWPAAATRRTAQRLLLAGWTAVTAATCALLLLRIPYTGSGRLADAFDLGGLADVIDTRMGTALVVRLLLLAAAAVFLAVLCGPYARTRAPDAADRPGEGRPGEGRRAGRGLGAGGTAVAAGLACTWAMSEHASSGPQTGLSVPADALHLMAVAAWLGGLVMLAALLHREPGLPRAAVRRYSGLAMVSVAALAATGLYQSWRQVRTLDALTGTDYGRLLLWKVVLVAAMLTAAFFSRRFTARLADGPSPGEPGEPGEPAEAPAGAVRSRATGAGAGPAATAAQALGPGGGAESPGAAGGQAAGPERARQLARQRAAVHDARRRRARDADPARAGLRRSVAAETAVAAAVLLVTTVLTTTTPARTATAEPAPQAAGREQQEPRGGIADPAPAPVPYDTGGESGQGTALLELRPGGTGENTLMVTLRSPEGRPNDAVELRVALTLPVESIGPLRYEQPERVAAGRWSFTGVRLPRPGAWDVALTIRTSDVDQTTVSTTLNLT